MNPVFLIPELLDMILSNMPRCDLAAVARTARPLYTAAVRYIWRGLDQDDLDCLFNLIPNSESDEPLDAAHFQRLASFVEHLDIYFEILHDLDFEGISLKLDRLPSVVLPRLRELSVTVGTQEDVDLAARFVVPSLKTVKIRTLYTWDHERPRDPSLVPLLRTIHETCTVLETFGAPDATNCGPRAPVTHLKRILERNLGLRSLYTGWSVLTYDHSVLDGLSRMQHLQHLYVQAPKADHVRPEEIPRSVAGDFPSLHSVIIFGEPKPISLVLSLLSRAPVSSLYCDVLFFDTMPNLNDYHRLSRAIGSLHATLGKLKLDIRNQVDYPDGNAPPVQVGATFFASLLECSLLRHFFFIDASWNLFDLSDELVESMAVSWPDLRTLCLGWVWDQKNIIRRLEPPEARADPLTRPSIRLVRPDSLTFASLIPLSKHCASLKDVKFEYLSAVQIPSPSAHIPSPDAIYRLQVNYSTVTLSLVPDIEAYVRALWPSLSRVGEVGTTGNIRFRSSL